MVFDTSKLGSWKTTVSGIVTAVAGFVAFSPGLFAKWPWMLEVSKYVMLGGLGAGFLSAKDSNVTGGSIANPKNAPTVVAATAAPLFPKTPLT